MKKATLIFFFLGIWITLFGQLDQTDTWYSYGMSKKVDDRISLTYLMQCRSQALKPSPGMFFVLGGFNYKMPDPRWKVGASYYLIEKRISTDDQEELYQAINFTREEVGYQYSWHKIKWSHKVRLEQVWGAETPFFQHVRFLNAVKIPIKKNNLAIKAYSELFYRLDGTGYNRNRIFAGIHLSYSRHTSLQLGYLSEIFTNRSSKNLFLGINNSF